MLASTRFSSLLAVAALGASACMTGADPTDSSDAATVASALEQPQGGMTTTDEAPAFGAEAELATAAIEASTAVADPMAQDATVADLEARPDVAHLRVAIVWGQLPPDRSVTAVTDWSGAIAINRGALIVRHRIAFEPATGDQLLPRTDRTTVAFASHTRPAADGLVLELLDPDPTAGALTLTYTPNSGATPISFPVADLLAGPVSVDVGSDGNRMIAIALRHSACDHGFVRGRWHAFRDGLGGFIGVVADDDGAPIGHVRGIWGVRKNGEHAFFGKYIANDGAFRGIVVGHWQGGAFVGRWLDRSGAEHGRVQGHYREQVGDAGAGHFMGRWAESSCAADLPADPAQP